MLTTNERVIKAYDLFREGYNCAQSVVLAYEDVLPLDFDILKAVSSAFGGGFARTRNVCGTMTGAGMVLGLMEKFTNDIAKDKTDVYKQTRLVTDEFIELNGTINCGELLKNVANISTDYIPQERNSEYYKTRPCAKFVVDAVKIIDNSDIFKEYIKSINK